MIVALTDTYTSTDQQPRDRLQNPQPERGYDSFDYRIQECSIHQGSGNHAFRSNLSQRLNKRIEATHTG